MKKPLVLCILDGVGISNKKEHNAVAKSKMPFFNGLLKKYPNSKLDASGVAVGLPPKTMGNSEVGHMTIGAGRIINQYLRRFQIEDWSKNKPLKNFIKEVKSDKGIVHLIGMMSDGSVHSNIKDIIVIAKNILDSKLKICIHFISDGRDTPPQSAQKYINKLKKDLKEDIAKGNVWFGTICGRYYAMDRNQNLDRTKIAFDAIANSRAEFVAKDINTALKEAYARGENDEFIKPIIIKSDHKNTISKTDGILFCNYRSDRARQILRSLLGIKSHILCFSQYGEGLNEKCPAMLTDIPVKNTMGDILQAAGKTQLRIAETEKYNHVTYFFDAERKIDFDGGEKILIPSPDVATFDLAPEMSAKKITDALLSKLSEFDVVILNYANGDMIGHTGVESAAIKTMECLDAQLSIIVPAVLKLDGTVLITADHGNVETLWNEKANAPLTSHTTNKVNFIVVSKHKYSVSDGGLSDIAPTMLKILNIKQPKEITGKSLVK